MVLEQQEEAEDVPHTEDMLMRERVDRGLEPISHVIVRVIDQVALVYMKPWLGKKKKTGKYRELPYEIDQQEDLYFDC